MDDIFYDYNYNYIKIRLCIIHYSMIDFMIDFIRMVFNSRFTYLEYSVLKWYHFKEII